jgi:Fe-S cluster assembly protein SufD
MTSTTTDYDEATGATRGLSTDHSRAVAEGAHKHGRGGTPKSSRADRISSFDLAQFPVPNGREEEWRFAPVDRLAPLFAAELSGPKVITTVIEAPEVTVEVVDRDDARLGRAGKPGDRTAATAWASFQRATVVTVPPQVVASTATTIRVEGIDASKPTASHVLVHAREMSEALVVLDHIGPATLAETVEVVVEDGAHLTLISVQDWAPGSVHASSHRLRLGRDATLKHIVVTLGGDVVRITPDAEFAGENGSVEMIGLYFADAGQHQEHRLFVDHAMPSCRSRVTYKGALQGEGAHTVWVGDVLIRAAAEGTDTYELNRNLVLSEGARADSVPNLEI